MMKSLSCKEMGMLSCNFIATGTTDEEVMAKMKKHATANHPVEMEKMIAIGDEAMTQMMQSHIKTEA